MPIQKKETIEQLVIDTLQKGAIATVDLILELHKVRPNTTKQGVYRVLRKLKNEEKVVIHGKLVSLNSNWITNMTEFFSLAQYYYSSKNSGANGFLNIQEKDKIIYHFNNLSLLDSFWSHAFNLLANITSAKEPIFIYNPHEWFFYARPETEKTLVKVLHKKSRQVLITVSHDDPLDKNLKRNFNNDWTQYNITKKKISPNDNYYFNIIGDYLIEVSINTSITKKINDFFKKTETFNDTAKQKLADIISSNGKNKLVISKNSRRIEKYKKMLVKDFFIMK